MVTERVTMNLASGNADEATETILDVYAEVVTQKDNPFFALGQVSKTFEDYTMGAFTPTFMYDNYIYGNSVPDKSVSDSPATQLFQDDDDYSYADCYNTNNKSQLPSDNTNVTLSHGSLIGFTQEQTEIPAIYDPYAEDNESDGGDEASTCLFPDATANTPAIDDLPLTTPVGMQAYILEDMEESRNPNLFSSSSPTPPKRTKVTKRKQPVPWYCVSRQISEQTKNIKIRSVNRSKYINISRILEKCRSMFDSACLRMIQKR